MLEVQKELIDYLDSIGLKCGTDVLIDTYDAVPDLYIPIYTVDSKLAIFLHDDYYSSNELGVRYGDLVKVTDKCIDAGVHPIHIWRRIWKEKKHVILNRLKTLTGKGDVYQARKCQILEIGTNLKNDFLNKYHIQGADISKVRLGLYHQGELVAVMTFGKPRFNKRYDYELIRYASKGRVIGGAGKLLKEFERKYNPKRMVSYADRTWSMTGRLYNVLGFKLINVSGPNYGYFIQDDKGNFQWLKRYTAQKHKLKGLLGMRFDPNMTEVENMRDSGYVMIFDCGNYVFEKDYINE